MTVRPYDNLLQIARASKLMGEQLLSVEETLFRVPVANRKGAHIHIKYLADGSDNKFLWKTNALTGQLYRSPSHLVPMSHFDLIVRSWLLRRSRSDVHSMQFLIKHWDEQLPTSTKTLAAVEVCLHRESKCS
jgi:hypothetical protein